MIVGEPICVAPSAVFSATRIGMEQRTNGVAIATITRFYEGVKSVPSELFVRGVLRFAMASWHTSLRR